MMAAAMATMTTYVSPDSSSLDENGDREERLRKWRIKKDIVAIICAIVIFILDQVGEVIVAYHYFVKEKIAHFSVTLSFIVIPFLAMTVTSLYWYWKDKTKSYCSPVSNCRTWTRYVVNFFQMGLLLRYCDTVYFGFKTMTNKDHEKRYEHEERRGHKMKLIEAFLECAPQAIAQIYIILQESTDTAQIYTRDIVRTLVVTRLFVSMAAALSLHHRATLCKDTRCRQISWWDTIVYFLWNEAFLTARIIAITLFATSAQYWVTCMLIISHWVAMTAWVSSQRTTNNVGIIFKNIAMGFVYIFCYMKVRKSYNSTASDDTRQLSVQQTEDKKQVYYYLLVITLESTAMVLWWYFNTDAVWIRKKAFMLYCLGMVCGTIFALFYYEMLRDNTPLLGRFRRMVPFPEDSSDSRAPSGLSPTPWQSIQQEHSPDDEQSISTPSTCSAHSDESLLLA